MIYRRPAVFSGIEYRLGLSDDGRSWVAAGAPDLVENVGLAWETVRYEAIGSRLGDADGSGALRG